MAKAMKTVDIGEALDWANLVEEVRETQEPCILRKNGEDVAVLAPIASRPKRGRKPRDRQADYAAALSAAGGWKGLVDIDELKAQLAASRGSDRPPADL